MCTCMHKSLLLVPSTHYAVQLGCTDSLGAALTLSIPGKEITSLAGVTFDHRHRIRCFVDRLHVSEDRRRCCVPQVHVTWCNPAFPAAEQEVVSGRAHIRRRAFCRSLALC